MGEGETSILNRAVVMHEQTGGPRQACGVISAYEVDFPITAQAQIGNLAQPEDTSTCYGTISFKQTSWDNTDISFDVKNCGAEGLHGFHVHTSTPTAGESCSTAGGHYNPQGAAAGEDNYVAIMESIAVDASGVGNGSISSDLVELTGAHSILDRSIVVHKTAANGGGRMACGPITQGSG